MKRYWVQRFNKSRVDLERFVNDCALGRGHYQIDSTWRLTGVVDGSIEAVFIFESERDYTPKDLQRELDAEQANPHVRPIR